MSGTAWEDEIPAGTRQRRRSTRRKASGPGQDRAGRGQTAGRHAAGAAAAASRGGREVRRAVRQRREGCTHQTGGTVWEEGMGGRRGRKARAHLDAQQRGVQQEVARLVKDGVGLGGLWGRKAREESAGGGTRGDAQRREAAVRDGGGMRQGVGAGVPVHAHPHPHPHPQPWTCAAFVAGVRGQVAAAWKLGGGPHLDLPPAPSPPPPAARSRWDPGGTTLRYMRQYTWPHKWRYETAAHPHTAAGSHPKAAHTSLSIHTHTHTHKMPLYTRSHKAPRRPT